MGMDMDINIHNTYILTHIDVYPHRPTYMLIFTYAISESTDKG